MAALSFHNAQSGCLETQKTSGARGLEVSRLTLRLRAESVRQLTLGM